MHTCRFMFLFVFFFLNPGLFAVEKSHITDHHSPEGLTWHSILNPKHHPQTVRSLPYYSAAEKILLLGDGFNPSISHLLAEDVEEFTSSQAQIYKTSLDCPDSLDSTQTGRILNLRIDHTQKLAFPDNFFDTIVMKKGLCHCDNYSEKTCGGLDFNEYDQARNFILETLRVLNKENPNSMLLIHGNHRPEGSSERAQMIHRREKNTEKGLTTILSEMAEEYIHLKFEMVYYHKPLDPNEPFLRAHTTFVGIKITARS